MESVVANAVEIDGASQSLQGEPKLTKPPHRQTKRRAGQTGQAKATNDKPAAATEHGEDGHDQKAEASRVKPTSPSKRKRAVSHSSQAEATVHKPPRVVGPAIEKLRYLHRDREFAMRLLTRQTLALKAMARTLLGWRPDLDADQRQAVRSLADDLVEVLRAHAEYPIKKAKSSRTREPKEIPDNPLSADDLEALKWYVASELQARLSYESRRDAMGDKMQEVSATIPGVIEFVKATPGCDFIAVARVLAESGGVFAADSVAAVWKRLGLAPPECYRMRKKNGETALLMPKRARSVCWTFGAGLILTQGPQEERVSKKGRVLPAKAEGPYYAIYRIRKEIELPRTATKMHAHKRAHRYMTKWAIRNLWLSMKGKPMEEWKIEK